MFLMTGCACLIRTSATSTSLSMRALMLQAASMLLLAPALDVQAAPPVLAIANEPLKAACRVAAPIVEQIAAREGAAGAVGTVGAGGDQNHADGPSLLRAAPFPASGTTADLFQATMDMTDWAGHFARYALSPANAGSAAPTMRWDAGALLTGDAARAPSPFPNNRKIFTSIVQPDGTLNMVPFEWGALSTEQRQLLDRAPAPSAAAGADALGEARLGFLRGERAQEGKLFRKRTSVLGDSVNSKPVFVGAGLDPAVAIARPNIIYVGANDGMLHAFDAADGTELFAYVPNALFATLNRLPGPDYVHQAYVDGPASAAEVMIEGANKTVLVAAMGGGAQGVFALDVTDPARFADSGALWEFTDRDDAMMGNVTTLPQIAKLRTSTVAGIPVYRHFAVVASGINNHAEDGNASASGKGALFLLALDKPRDRRWQLNDNYFRLMTPIAETTLANALSAPVLTNDGNGALRFGYAGDLQGNLWRFDFGGGAPWHNAVGPGPGGAPIFVARDAGGTRQPITQQPALAYANGGGYLVLFGTGKLIEQGDRTASSFAPQSYYAIRDKLRNPAELISSRQQLTARVLNGDVNAPLLSVDGDRMDFDSRGWYVDFLQAAITGERSIDSGVLTGGTLMFNTLLPAADPCDKARRRTYALNVLTGLAADRSVVTNLLPASAVERPVVGLLSDVYASAPFLVQTTSSATARDPTRRTRVDKEFSITDATSGGSAKIGEVKVKSWAGRLSWREVGNWRALHEAAK
jgi:type IV pilus assembly protein PilY1